MSRIPWSLGARLLARDWRSGEVLVLLAALVVAVAAMSAVTFFTDRVRAAVSQQAGEALAADLRIDSSSDLPAGVRVAAEGHGLATADVVSLRSVVVAGRTTSLADVRGVTRDLSVARRGPRGGPARRSAAAGERRSRVAARSGPSRACWLASAWPLATRSRWALCGCASRTRSSSVRTRGGVSRRSLPRRCCPSTTCSHRGCSRRAAFRAAPRCMPAPAMRSRHFATRSHHCCDRRTESRTIATGGPKCVRRLAMRNGFSSSRRS